MRATSAHLISVFIIVLSLVAATGCQTSQTQLNAETILMPEKGGDFRGIHIGDQPKAIKRNEQATSVYSMPDELIYRFEPEEIDSTWYEISYNFHQDGLNHIHLDVYPANDALFDHLMSDFQGHYQQRFGDGKTHGSQLEWRSLTEHGRLVTVSLSKGNGKENRSCIRLLFNESMP
jgi:hypothetical protein